MTTRTGDALVEILQARFAAHRHRHTEVRWPDVIERLRAHPDALRSLGSMEQTGGEPDVIGHDPRTGELVFCDCSEESPSGRRSLCYDAVALKSRKENRPEGSAVEAASAMGVELLTEDDYLALQAVGEFDRKTSSWIRTPEDVRALGGALFGDRRYGRVFTYHNGAQSYYAARGFRGIRRV